MLVPSSSRSTYNPAALTAILRKPSVAVACWAVLVIGLFVWSGDLGVEARASAEVAASVATDARQGAADPAPVVVRRATGARLPRTARHGLVFDSMGFLLVGADVTTSAGDSRRTDPDGAFAVELVEQRASDLLVRADGRRSAWLRTSAVAPGPVVVCLEPAAPWDATPQPPAAAPMLRGEGEVVGPDGLPLRNAFVNVLGTDCWGRTDDIGRVEVPLTSRSSTFVVHAPSSDDSAGGFAVRSAPFVAPRPRGIVPMPRLVAEPAGSIRGVVRDASGAPVAGLPVEVRGAGGARRTTTGAGGAFVLEGLLAADYVVEPFAYRGQVGQETQVRVDRAVVPCDLQLTRVPEASLLVVNEQGEAASGIWVAASLHGLRRGVGQADARGVVNLPMTGEAEFEVRTADDYAACAVRSFDVSGPQAKLVIAQP